MAQHFDRTFGTNPAENYERFFVPFIGGPLAADLVREADLRPGERVLDAACGTGVVARLAAAQVGPDGEVAGLDVNPGMLAVAATVAQDPSIEWHEGSVEEMPLADDAFDAVLCQLSLQFVDDRPRALRDMRRVLAPGGRLTLNVPGPISPMFETLADALGRHVDPRAGGFVRAVFDLDDEDEVLGLLRGAGFQDVTVRAHHYELPLPAPRDFLWQYIASTPLAGLVSGAAEEERSALEDEVVAGWGAFADGEGMRYPQRVLLASARKLN